MSRIYIPKVRMQGDRVVTEDQVVKTEFNIKFEFSEQDTFPEIVAKLDKTMSDERKKAVEAIAKFKGVEINWNEQ